MRRNHYRKKKIKRWIIVVICFCLLLVMVYFQLTRIQLMMKGYGLYEQNIILSLSDKEIEDYLSYGQVIDFDSWDEVKNQKHYYDYHLYAQLSTQQSKSEIVQEIDQFYDLYENKLSSLQYDIDICRELMKTYSLSDLSTLAKGNYTYDEVKKYLHIKGCIVDDLKQYIESKKEPLDAILSISYPFIDSQNKVNQTYMINDPSNLLVFIKKGFQVPASYVPEDLVEVDIPIAPDNTHSQLRKEAANALKKMYDDGLALGYHLVLNSGYRSYQDQKALYDEYFRIYDEVTASGLVSIPGSSEHQLGLGVDLTSQSVIDKEKLVFGDTDEYKWVVKNAHLYGFIMRYPKERSSQTGTLNEPWHLRYVGKDVAKEIYENQWTLEDYILHHGLSYTLSKI